MKERIAKIIEEYDNQGIHRTGTQVDLVNARWLLNEIKKIGLKPFLYGFLFKGIDIEEASIKIEENEIHGIPLFDCNFPENELIVGSIGSIDSNATIGITKISSRDTNRFTKKRRRSRNQGLVAATVGATPGLTPINADNFENPFGPPTLQVPSDAWMELHNAAKANKKAKLKIRIKRRQAEAFNVLTRIKGKDSDKPPLIVITPRSGWWHCAAERGGGIAALLEMMKGICSNNSVRDVLFMANTGHELGHLGFNHFLENHEGIVKKAKNWIHLGANFAATSRYKRGAYPTSSVILQASNYELQNLILEEMNNHNIAPDICIPIGNRPFGEAQNIYDIGGNYVSILGNNSFFHHPDDRWPKAIDIDKATKIIEAFISLGIKLSQ